MSPQDDPLPIDTTALTPESLAKRLGPIDMRQVAIWRAMTPARRLQIACQLHQLALDAVRTTERHRHPELSEHALAQRVARRMGGIVLPER